jgi:4-alpha-glucanotransferase
MGIGDTTALVECAEWLADNGFNLLQLLPINETGRDNSPYNAISSRALNPLTLDVSPGALRDLPANDAERVIESHPGPAQSACVDYKAVRSLYNAMLRAAHAGFLSHAVRERREEFEVFRRSTGSWLDAYVLYRTFIDHYESESWSDWPEECRTFDRAQQWIENQAPDTQHHILSECVFHSYVQWIAHQQWDFVRTRCEELGVQLMGDIPFGVSYNSADVFAEPHLFDFDCFGGAPPESYFKDDIFTQRWGQNWGIPLYRWDVMRGDGHRWWRRRVKGVTRYFHAFRIDHILGFYRIYRFPWAPSANETFTHLSHDEAAALTGGRLPGFFPQDDWAPDRAESNRADGDERLRMVLEAADGALVVGEDLGVVPDYVRPHLRDLGILGIKVPMWERNAANRLVPGNEYHELSLATYGTHDHEPMRSLWGRLLTDCRNGEEHNDSRWQLVTLAEFSGLSEEAAMGDYEKSLHGELMAGLLRSNSRVVVYMITDLLGQEDRFNVPGSVSGLNWAVRLPQAPHFWTIPGALRTALTATESPTLIS